MRSQLLGLLLTTVAAIRDGDNHLVFDGLTRPEQEMSGASELEKSQSVTLEDGSDHIWKDQDWDEEDGEAL